MSDHWELSSLTINARKAHATYDEEHHRDFEIKSKVCGAWDQKSISAL